MVSALLEHQADDGFIRANYMQLGADTGRMSCREPNLQQTPRDKKFRECVQAPKGWLFVDADYSGMELRLAAALSQDPVMTKAFQDGADLHQITADKIGCDRQTAKAVSFGLLFGGGATGLRNYAGAMGMTMTLEEASFLRTEWLDTYYGIAKWQREKARESDRTARDKWPEVRVPVSDFRRYLIGDLNRLTVRANTPIQGSGAAILKCALGNLWPLIKEAGEGNAKLAACIHDEIACLVRADHAEHWAAVLKRIMEDAEARWLGDVPALAEVRIGETWADAH
jgi:DNA polymerase I-like protein with 3'-5' exonuclease and polymerase domains